MLDYELMVLFRRAAALSHVFLERLESLRLSSLKRGNPSIYEARSSQSSSAIGDKNRY
jgi:hypothetical protein